jgi:sugar O-acyltransferase (sialic acid O-acetyltransferase NeuD family)|tara:strand:+ start:97 stop:741 length:645 start_codon:yes stop_codon:yes gene_type:complete
MMIKQKKNVYIVGAGQLGVLVSNILKEDKNYKIVGFIDTKKRIKNKINGIKIFKSEAGFLKNDKIKKYFFLAIGNISAREKIIKKFNNKNVKFLKLIEKNVKLGKKTTIGRGSIILNSSIILNNTRIGNFVIVGTSTIILHNVRIGNNCIVGGGSKIGANTNFEKNILVGVGSVFSSNKKKIGENSIICSGTVIHKTIKKNSKLIGNPARYIPR